jgi:hypothetical protein
MVSWRPWLSVVVTREAISLFWENWLSLTIIIRPSCMRISDSEFGVKGRIC